MFRRRSRPVFAPRRNWRPAARAAGWVLLLGFAVVFMVVTVQGILDEDLDSQRPGSPSSVEEGHHDP